MSAQIFSLLSTFISAAITFIGVTITIVTLAPALIGIAKTHTSDFFAAESSRLKLDKLLRGLAFNLLILAISVLSGIVCLFQESLCFFWIAFFSMIIGFLLLVIFGFLIAMTILNLLKG